jgi:carboxylate-amine ligase
VEPRTVGIEEEFLLVDPSDGKPRATATAVLSAAEMPQSDDVEAELQLQQIETGTQPCRSLDQLEKRIRSARRSASAAARSIGVSSALPPAQRSRPTLLPDRPSDRGLGGQVQQARTGVFTRCPLGQGQSSTDTSRIVRRSQP